MNYGIVALVFATFFAALMGIHYFVRARQMAFAHWERRLGLEVRGRRELLKQQTGGHLRLRDFLEETGLGWQPTHLIQWGITATSVGIIVGAFLLEGPGAVMFGLAGAAFFPVRAHLAREARLRKCDQQMPQALRLMSLALRAGHALPGALGLAAREAPAPLRDELRKAVEQHALGVPMAEVIDRLALRLHVCDAANTFAVAVRVLEQTGGNLITVIDNVIDAAQARGQFLAKLRALTAEGRYSAYIVGSLPPGFFLLAGFTDDNYYPTIFGSASGWGVLGLSTVLWMMGILWTRKLLSTKAY